jgi:hypothetical protein
VRPHDSKRIIFILSGIGLAAAILNASGGGGFSVPELGQASGSVPDLPGLREREALEPGFIATFLWVVQQTSADGDRLAALISEESGFNPQARNPNGATGFLQWLVRYAPVSGYTTDQLYAMTGIQQLAAVMNTIVADPAYKTDPAMAGGGWSPSLPDSAIVLAAGTSAEAQNSGYDKAGKGYVTAGDVRSAVYGPLNGAGRISV